ncbi:LamG domain-containing protein [Opitutaceae bacterium TAV4]|nr:LamG domain-containing protein [Opitutaceae bacterium TAV4]RRJ99013.1 LamG domain-containing protein [Opitutaceae bacterium TAV3]
MTLFVPADWAHKGGMFPPTANPSSTNPTAMKSPCSPVRVFFVLMLIATVLGLAGTTTQSFASVLGYWRFENGTNLYLDSSGNGMDLNSSGGTVTSLLLPETGAGSHFGPLVPNTGDSNLRGANFGDQAGLLRRTTSTGILKLTTEFTVEAFVNVATTSATGNRYIASRWISNSTTKECSWSFGVNSAGVLIGRVSADGTAATTFNSTLTLTAGVDYYVGFSFDLNNQASGVTFYLQDLNGGELQTKSFAHSFSTFYGTPNAQFTIGALQGTSASNMEGGWSGLIDEVRLSNTVLTSSQLLAASIPEPANAGLLMAGLCAAVFLLQSIRRRFRH